MDMLEGLLACKGRPIEKEADICPLKLTSRDTQMKFSVCTENCRIGAAGSYKVCGWISELTHFRRIFLILIIFLNYALDVQCLIYISPKDFIAQPLLPKKHSASCTTHTMCSVYPVIWAHDWWPNIERSMLDCAPIEEPLEMPYWNSLCLKRICLFVYVFSVTKPNFMPRSLMGS